MPALPPVSPRKSSQCWSPTRSCGWRWRTPPPAAGTDPDRASFSIALNTARDLVIQAAGVFSGAVIDLVGTIGRRILAALMPDRRVRTRPRVVKRAISRYNARGTVDRTTYRATISVHILTPAP
ncbi:hypothetical protein ACFQ60_02375 [Streptomyces zhihengii]